MNKINNSFRQISIWLGQPFQNNSALLSGLLAMSVLLVLACKCGTNVETSETQTEKPGVSTKSNELPRRAESYEIKGFKFTYYLIPKDLNREALIETAQKLHDAEPDRHLILIDDESGLADYVNYAKEFSKGNPEAEYPKAWVDEHIIANVQKNMDGSWNLNESNGYEKIAKLD